MERRNSLGPMAAVIIIFLVMLLGAIYVIVPRLNHPAPAATTTTEAL